MGVAVYVYYPGGKKVNKVTSNLGEGKMRWQLHPIVGNELLKEGKSQNNEWWIRTAF